VHSGYRATRRHTAETVPSETNVTAFNTRFFFQADKRIRDGSVGMTSRLPARRQGQETFLYVKASKPAVGPIQPPIQWVQWALAPGAKLSGREADHSPPNSAEVKNREAIPPLPDTSSWRDA
jgi:hypothetical protein